jgi:hypothetical protein
MHKHKKRAPRNDGGAPARSRTGNRKLHAPRPSQDCCDLRIAKADATRDEDLPAAEGGIA